MEEGEERKTLMLLETEMRNHHILTVRQKPKRWMCRKEMRGKAKRRHDTMEMRDVKEINRKF